MKINIYQINHERDTHRVAFVDTKYLEKAQGLLRLTARFTIKFSAVMLTAKLLMMFTQSLIQTTRQGIVAGRFQYRMWLRFWRMKVWKKAFISAIPTTSRR